MLDEIDTQGLCCSDGGDGDTNLRITSQPFLLNKLQASEADRSLYRIHFVEAEY
jgi:hypothetical protein